MFFFHRLKSMDMKLQHRTVRWLRLCRIWKTWYRVAQPVSTAGKPAKLIISAASPECRFRVTTTHCNISSFESALPIDSTRATDSRSLSLPQHRAQADDHSSSPSYCQTCASSPSNSLRLRRLRDGIRRTRNHREPSSPTVAYSLDLV